jgi:hypothetical protein
MLVIVFLSVLMRRHRLFGSSFGLCSRARRNGGLDRVDSLTGLDPRAC